MSTSAIKNSETGVNIRYIIFFSFWYKYNRKEIRRVRTSRQMWRPRCYC